jgi:hypothetical protein
MVIYARRSVLTAAGTSRRSDLFVPVVHAEGLLRQGEPDEACAVATRALASSHRLSSARGEAYIAALLRASAPYATRPAT